MQVIENANVTPFKDIYTKGLCTRLFKNNLNLTDLHCLRPQTRLWRWRRRWSRWVGRPSRCTSGRVWPMFRRQKSCKGQWTSTSLRKASRGKLSPWNNGWRHEAACSREFAFPVCEKNGFFSTKLLVDMYVCAALTDHSFSGELSEG